MAAAVTVCLICALPQPQTDVLHLQTRDGATAAWVHRTCFGRLQRQVGTVPLCRGRGEPKTRLRVAAR